MSRREKLHPALWLNKMVASPVFIVLVNLAFVILLFRRVDAEKVDFSMSWVTMAMDQVIINAGWVIYRKGVRARKEDRAVLLEILRHLKRGE